MDFGESEATTEIAILAASLSANNSMLKSANLARGLWPYGNSGPRRGNGRKQSTVSPEIAVSHAPARRAHFATPHEDRRQSRGPNAAGGQLLSVGHTASA